MCKVVGAAYSITTASCAAVVCAAILVDRQKQTLLDAVVQRTMLRKRLTIEAGLCLVGALQLIAFTSLIFELPFVFGRDGVAPLSRTLADGQAPQHSLSLLALHDAVGFTAEAFLALVVVIGWSLSVLAACGVTHPLVFTGLWYLILELVSTDSPFINYGDEVLLEVSFAAIWLAISHSNIKKAEQQQQQRETEIGDEPTEQQQKQQQQSQLAARLSAATLLLFQWLLFRLLLVTSSLSATAICGPDPSLASCFKSLVAQGQPHVATWWLLRLPRPAAVAGAAIMLLELPAAFLALLYAPALRHITALALLGLQLLRITLGPASLANLAAAVLCFMLLDDACWVPRLAKLGAVLGRLGNAPRHDSEEQEQADVAVQTRMMRTDSKTSLFDGEFGETDQKEELGETLFDGSNWVPWAAGAAFCLCTAWLFTYTNSSGVMLRPTPGQLHGVLQVAVPLAMLAWAAMAAAACWQAITASLTACRAKYAAAKAAAADAAHKAEVAAAAAAAVAAQSPAAAPAAPPTPRASGQVAHDDGDAASSPQANGEVVGGADAELPGKYLHFLGLQPPVPPAAAAELLHDEGRLANGDGAAGTVPSAAGSGAGAGRGAARGRGRAGGRAAGRGRGVSKAAAAAANAPPGALHQGAGGVFAGVQPAASADQEAAADAASPTADGATASAANGHAAVAAAQVARAATAAQPAGGAEKQAAAAEAGAKARTAKRAVLWAWMPAVHAVLVTSTLLGVFVLGAPLVLEAAGYDEAAIRVAVPDAITGLGASWGIGSSSARAREACLATQQAAATSGPGSIVQYEAWVTDMDKDWARVPLRYTLGASHHRSKSSLWQKLRGVRGWCQMRLQTRLAMGAEDRVEEGLHEWLGLLADKVVEGSHTLDGLLDKEAQPYQFTAIARVPYVAKGVGWRMDGEHQAHAMPPQQRGSLALTTYRQDYQALPGNDGVLAGLLDALARRASGPAVLAVVLALVALRHLLLPGGLLKACQHAAAVGQPETAAA